MRAKLLILIVLIAAAAVFFVPAIPQNQDYHELAETREVLGIANFGDVVTHLLYLFVGLAGIRWLLSKRGGRRADAFTKPAEAWNYAALFVGFTLTAFGSTWYHLNPCDSTLLWDRLAMAVTFMGLTGVIIAERVSIRASLILLPALLALGLGCVVGWRVGDDLRFYYGWVQAAPMLAILLMMLLFSPRYSHWGYFWWMFATYALADVAEQFDRPIYRLTAVLSGHTLKHILVAAAFFWIVLMLRRRSRLAQPAEASAKAGALGPET